MILAQIQTDPEESTARPVQLSPFMSYVFQGEIRSYEYLLARDEAERNAGGVYTVVEPDPHPFGLAPLSVALSFDGSQVVAVPTYPELDVQTAIAAECARINAASDAADAADFAYDFGDTPALNTAGQQVRAGVRHLQMAEANLKDWQGQALRANALVGAGNPDGIVRVIVSDNAVVLASAAQFLACFEAGCQRREANATWRVTRKALVRSKATVEEVVATRASTDTGWS